MSRQQASRYSSAWTAERCLEETHLVGLLTLFAGLPNLGVEPTSIAPRGLGMPAPTLDVVFGSQAATRVLLFLQNYRQAYAREIARLE